MITLEDIRMNKLNDVYIKEVCKLGKGEECCAYLVAGSDGFECAKGTELVFGIEYRLAEGQMNAKGDGCQGIELVLQAHARFMATLE